MSLLDLWQVIVEQKKFIFMIWATCVLLALIYVFVATPVFKAEAFLLPPSQKDVQQLNVPILNDSNSNSNYTPEYVYDLFVQTLKSRANRRSFYEEHGVAEHLGYSVDMDEEFLFDVGFHKILTVNRNTKKEEQAGFVSLSFEFSDADLAAKWVNSFVQETSVMVSERLADEVYAKINSLQSNLQSEIDGKLLLAKKRRLDRITQLKEAVTIARLLSAQDKSIRSLGGLSINTTSIPLYMLSAGALRGEMKMLEARQDDSAFIEGLRDLEERLAALEQVNVDAGMLKPMFFDQKAFAAAEPIKPNKTLIMILASILGLMLGVVVAFIANGLKGSKQENT
ncbi:MAG: Wzz/FepE/Etk N-terminal domain-containing protein [Mariprofundaceae bacterium]|nr:Wzz/FepE/Etk N-terminal domain-containing protein [Mariprofundaceae bacterium]